MLSFKKLPKIGIAVSFWENPKIHPALDLFPDFVPTVVDAVQDKEDGVIENTIAAQAMHIIKTIQRNGSQNSTKKWVSQHCWLSILHWTTIDMVSNLCLVCKPTVLCGLPHLAIPYANQNAISHSLGEM